MAKKEREENKINYKEGMEVAGGVLGLIGGIFGLLERGIEIYKKSRKKDDSFSVGEMENNSKEVKNKNDLLIEKKSKELFPDNKYNSVGDKLIENEVKNKNDLLIEKKLKELLPNNKYYTVGDKLMAIDKLILKGEITKKKYDELRKEILGIND